MKFNENGQVGFIIALVVLILALVGMGTNQIDDRIGALITMLAIARLV